MSVSPVRVSPTQSLDLQQPPQTKDPNLGWYDTREDTNCGSGAVPGVIYARTKETLVTSPSVFRRETGTETETED